MENRKWETESYESTHLNPKLLMLNAKLLSFNAQIDGIDLDKGIERFGGDGESYAEVLRIYVRNMRHLLDNIGDINEGCPADYAAIVHGIKGASRGICAENTADLAEALETAAGNGEYGYVLINNAAFVKTVRALLTDIGAVLAQIREESPKPARGKPDEEALERLRKACVSHDTDAVDSIIAGLEGYEYETGGELVARLRENAEQMNYSEIAKLLAARPPLSEG